MDITHYLRQVVILVHYNCLVAPPEKSAVALVTSVESLRIESIKMPHHSGKIPLGRAQTHMIVITHEAIGKYFHPPTIVNFTDGLKKGFVVLPVEKNLLPRTSAVHDVIDSSGILDTKRRRHTMLVPLQIVNYQPKI